MLDIFITFLKDFAVWLALFGVLMGVSVRFGIDSLRNLVLSLYLGTLVWLMFPYRDDIFDIMGDTSLTRMALFVFFASAASYLMKYIVASSFEKPFEFFHKKAVYAFAGSVLIIIIGTHVLDITTPTLLNSAPLITLFGNESFSFYWFIAPLFAVTLL